MARPTKPKQVKKAQGTYTKSRDIVSLNLQPLKEMPAIPNEFNEDERWFFQTVCEALFNSGLLRSADLMTIESMAGWWFIMKESQRDIRKNGIVQVASTGYKNVSPLVVSFEKAWNKLKDFSDRYGFNLLSKDKISAPPKNDSKADELKRMMNEV
jgi:P27 family predicted phage terminase small subunit